MNIEKPQPGVGSDLDFSFRDLAMKVYPEMNPDASMPEMAQAALGPCWPWNLESFVNICRVIGSFCFAHPSEVCGVSPTKCAAGVRTNDCKEKSKPECLKGSPSDKPCGAKDTKCRPKTDCDPTHDCGKCTHNFTECHCTHDQKTECPPGGENSCNKTEKWCAGDGATCEAGDNDTNGCGCTISPCTVACTNKDTKFEEKPASPAEKSAMAMAGIELLAQLRADLLSRKSNA